MKINEIYILETRDETLGDICEKIADDYAIAFAEWIIDIENKPTGNFTVKELLKLFKKEKGL